MSNPLAKDLDHVLHHTRGLWEELRGQRVFITGGTGFFGCWLLESFAWANEALKLNAQAVVLSRNPQSLATKAPHLLNNPAISFVIGDVRDFEFPAGQFSHVIHAATEASAKLNAENPLLMLDTIVDGTRHVLDFSQQAGVKKFLLTSSGAIYGAQPSGLTHIPEEYSGAPDPLSPSSAYGEGKRLAEHLCSLYAQMHSIETKIARCFAFVGPYLPLDTHFAIGNFIRDALANQPIQIKGDGTPYRSYLYAADLVIWLWTILFCGKSAQAYNVGSNHDLSIAELATVVNSCLGKCSEIQITQPSQIGTVKRYVPSICKAQKDMALTVRIPLMQAIQNTARWHKTSIKTKA